MSGRTFSPIREKDSADCREDVPAPPFQISDRKKKMPVAQLYIKDLTSCISIYLHLFAQVFRQYAVHSISGCVGHTFRTVLSIKSGLSSNYGTKERPDGHTSRRHCLSLQRSRSCCPVFRATGKRIIRPGRADFQPNYVILSRP